MNDSCLFCRILRGDIPAARIAENAHAIAFRDIDPKAPTHVLIVPRRHVESLAVAADPGELGQMLLLAQQVAAEAGLASGWRLVANTGPDGGQSVNHLHFHVLGGRQMGWPPG